jgi:hypothetical protein
MLEFWLRPPVACAMRVCAVGLLPAAGVPARAAGLADHQSTTMHALRLCGVRGAVSVAVWPVAGGCAD